MEGGEKKKKKRGVRAIKMKENKKENLVSLSD